MRSARETLKKAFKEDREGTSYAEMRVAIGYKLRW